MIREGEPRWGTILQFTTARSNTTIDKTRLKEPHDTCGSFGNRIGLQPQFLHGVDDLG
jgi:hypothetical protein